MKLKQIRQELEQVMTEYGPDGDQSLEYYGLVIQDGECRSAKLYRRASRKSDEAELIAKYQNQSFFQAVIQYAKIYDFSLRRDEAGMTYMRLVFLPFKDVLRSEERFAQLLDLCHLNCDSAYFKQLTAYYHEMEFTGLSPLLKMGVELSESGEVLEAKAYFALKSYDDIYDNLGKRHLYDSCRHLVDKSLSLLQMGDLSDSFAEIAERLERIQYYPIFTGVNFADGYVEIKVYYETCFSSYDSATILHQENALAAMMLPEAAEMEEMHQGILKRIGFSGSHTICSWTKHLFNPECWNVGDLKNRGLKTRTSSHIKQCCWWMNRTGRADSWKSRRRMLPVNGIGPFPCFCMMETETCWSSGGPRRSTIPPPF